MSENTEISYFAYKTLGSPCEDVCRLRVQLRIYNDGFRTVFSILMILQASSAFYREPMARAGWFFALFMCKR